MFHLISYYWLVVGEQDCNINQFFLQECVDFTWRVSDCAELVGVTHWRRWEYEKEDNVS